MILFWKFSLRFPLEARNTKSPYNSCPRLSISCWRRSCQSIPPEHGQVSKLLSYFSRMFFQWSLDASLTFLVRFTWQIHTIHTLQIFSTSVTQSIWFWCSSASWCVPRSKNVMLSCQKCCHCRCMWIIMGFRYKSCSTAAQKKNKSNSQCRLMREASRSHRHWGSALAVHILQLVHGSLYIQKFIPLELSGQNENKLCVLCPQEGCQPLVVAATGNNIRRWIDHP